jgi:catechol 2,3-dioxygenase-like lactoylglutathione lyase family enzyme
MKKRAAVLLIVLAAATAFFMASRGVGRRFWYPYYTALAGGRTQDRVVVGLDHIPIAVSDLEAAADRYRELGFTLKAGRPHDNGIQNQHAKFPDGTELELITAPEARDALTTIYRRHLESGDGPAFLALYAPTMERATERLEATGQQSLEYIFLGPRNHSLTDRPEHFTHANGALSLISVWLAGEDLSRERRLLQALGARLDRAEVHVPDPRMAEIARLPEGDVVLLPASSELVVGRRIVGATVRVKSVASAKRLLGRRALAPRPRVSGARSSSVYLAPAVTHGLWLELREVWSGS